MENSASKMQNNAEIYANEQKNIPDVNQIYQPKYALNSICFHTIVTTITKFTISDNPPHQFHLSSRTGTGDLEQGRLGIRWLARADVQAA